MVKNIVKPIQPTPTLSGKDAKAIINEALVPPSKESIQKNKQLLKEYSKIFKE